MSTVTAPTSAAAAAPAATATVDPSSWGIPQGEAATRRHIESGLKAGEVDPVTGRRILHYHDPMVPGKKFEAPGKSPFMDMMLVPAYAGGEGADASTITVSPRIQQNLGLRTGEVTRSPRWRPEVLAVGAIAWNERDQALVQARALGYVERLHVRATLDRVAQGPGAGRSLRAGLGRRAGGVPVGAPHAGQRSGAAAGCGAPAHAPGRHERGADRTGRKKRRRAGAHDAVRADRRRIDRAECARGQHGDAGHDAGAHQRPCHRLGRGTSAGKPGGAVARRRAGQGAQSGPAGHRRFAGRVQALLPVLNTGTRTLRVRMELGNPGGQLVPGMFVEMALSGPPQEKALLIPSEALIRTGRRTLVMVAEADGSFRPVEVEAGIETGDKTEIRRGLQAGQKVVLSGQFLIDSEASLKGVETRLGPSASTARRPARIAPSARIEAVAGDVLTLTHPPIPALQWPAMTMDFKLAPNLKESDFGRRPGDRDRVPHAGRRAAAASYPCAGMKPRAARDDRPPDPLVDGQPLPGAAGERVRRRVGRLGGARARRSMRCPTCPTCR